jgi:hypothetical protein
MYKITFYYSNDKRKNMHMFVSSTASTYAEAVSMLKNQVSDEFFVAQNQPISKIKPEFQDKITDLNERYTKKRFQ